MVAQYPEPEAHVKNARLRTISRSVEQFTFKSSCVNNRYGMVWYGILVPELVQSMELALSFLVLFIGNRRSCASVIDARNVGVAN